jgi:hypothetical protein
MKFSAGAGPLAAALALAAALTADKSTKKIAVLGAVHMVASEGGVAVTATNQSTNVPYTAVSNNAGNYTITSVPLGTYVVKAELSGFKTATTKPFVLEAKQIARLDLKLELGSLEDKVEVTAEAPVLQTETATVGEVVSAKTVESLPLNGRFFQHLITMTPGAMPFYGRGDSAENASSAGAKIATAHTVNGMPWSGNNYLLDGVVNNEMQNAYINITPPLEAIQEFKEILQTNSENLSAIDGIGSILFQMAGGLRASMHYCGCASIAEMHAKAEFVEITSSGMRESHVHDVQITKEAPNYRAE